MSMMPLSERSGGSVDPARSRIPGNLRSEEHTSELQSRLHLVCRLLLEKKKYANNTRATHLPFNLSIDTASHTVPRHSYEPFYHLSTPRDRVPLHDRLTLPDPLRPPLRI